MNRGNRGQAIFLDHDDYAFFLKELEVTARRYGWNCLSYCLMPNHFHLVIETPRRTLAAGMQRFAGMYAQRFNRRHRKDGHLFQGRYKNKIVDSEPYLEQVLRYLAFNPVAGELCARPEQWRWSSHRDLIARTPASAHAHNRLAQLLPPSAHDKTNPYRQLFADLAPPAEPPPPLDELIATLPRRAALLVAHAHGYYSAAIATALGMERSSVRRVISASKTAAYGALRTPSTPDAIAASQPP